MAKHPIISVFVGTRPEQPLKDYVMSSWKTPDYMSKIASNI